MSKWTYLGPAGTFSHQALRALKPECDEDEFEPAGSVTAALDDVRHGRMTGAVIPMENSVEGSVSATLDELAIDASLMITEEVAIPVEFDLIAAPGTALADITTVTTHPHAHAQCRAWLAEHLPEADIIPAASTAAAAAAVASGGMRAEGVAVIASKVAADFYGLEMIASSIGDAEAAHTRFILVELAGKPAPATGSDKTTLVVFMHEDQPGALLGILTEFAVRGVNLTRIESRPTKRNLGDYYFSIDLEGHLEDARVGQALTGLHRLCAEVRFLGSYARHDGGHPHVPQGTTNEDFAEAEDWLRSIRGH